MKDSRRPAVLFFMLVAMLVFLSGCKGTEPRRTQLLKVSGAHPKADASKFKDVRSAAMRLSTALGTKVGISEYLQLVTEMRTQVRLLDESSLNSTEKKVYSFYSKSSDEYTEAATLWNCRNDGMHTAIRTFSNPGDVAILDEQCVLIAQRHNISIETPKFKPSLRIVRWPDALQSIWWDAEIEFANSEEVLHPVGEAQIKDAEKVLDSPSE